MREQLRRSLENGTPSPKVGVHKQRMGEVASHHVRKAIGAPIKDGHDGAVGLAVTAEALKLLMRRHPNEPMRADPIGRLPSKSLPSQRPKGRKGQAAAIKTARG